MGKVKFHRRAAGLVCVSFSERRHLHLAVRRGHWIWGREQDWYDGPINYFGLGPLLLVCW